MRKEKDMLGEMLIPDEAYYGIHTARALENFRITGRSIHPELIKALVLVKKSCCHNKC